MEPLHSEVARILDRIPIDFGGGCSQSKAYLMAWLIRRYGMQITVDIGVYRGRSLFPQALAHKRFAGGVVYGVDPWSASEAREDDNPEKKKAIDRFVNRTDFEAIYQNVDSLNHDLGYENHCVLLRQTSASAASYFEQENLFFDMVHIDGNHDTAKVMEDVDLYLLRLNGNGFIVMDDVSWSSVRPAYEALRSKTSLVFERVDKANDYAVFWNNTSRLGAVSLRMMLRYIGSGNP